MRRGEIRWADPDPVVQVWNAPIIEALRQIPLLECVSVTLTEGSGEHRLSGVRAVS